jgi:hypothetical protein
LGGCKSRRGCSLGIIQKVISEASGLKIYSFWGACVSVTLRGSREALNGREPYLLAGEDVKSVSEYAVGVCEGDDAVGDGPKDLIRVWGLGFRV